LFQFFVVVRFFFKLGISKPCMIVFRKSCVVQFYSYHCAFIG
jgi:hypothetical protein